MVELNYIQPVRALGFGQGARKLAKCLTHASLRTMAWALERRNSRLKFKLLLGLFPGFRVLCCRNHGILVRFIEITSLDMQMSFSRGPQRLECMEMKE